MQTLSNKSDVLTQCDSQIISKNFDKICIDDYIPTGLQKGALA